jgi:hypothetical protein
VLRGVTPPEVRPIGVSAKGRQAKQLPLLLLRYLRPLLRYLRRPAALRMLSFAWHHTARGAPY